MEKVRINEICNISNGYAFKSDKYISENGARVIRITNVQKGQIVDNDPKLYPYYELDKLDAYKIYEGDILMSLTGNVGRVGRYPKELLPAYINQRVCRVMPKNENLDTNFLFHFLNSDVFEKEAIKNSAGAAQLNLSTKWLGDFEIPLPPLATQQKIAAILDQASAMIANNQAIVAKYDALTQSLFLEMFGDPVKNEKGWEKSEFKKFGKISTGNTPSRSDEENYNVDFIEWIKTDNIKEHEFYISQAQEYLSEKGATKGRIVSKNSLLVTCIAGSLQSIGRAAVTSHTVAFNQQINAIEPNENVNISFLYYLVKKSRKYIQDHASTGMKRMLTKGEFEKIKMILPPIQLQTQFAERVQAIEAQKKQAQLELAKSEELFQSLLQRAFKGELN